MVAPLFIIVQGAPGVGKTTLLAQLRQDFTIPMLGKDEVKELLFDVVPQSDREFSRLQGAASFEMIYAFARTLLSSGQSVLLEGAFGGEIAKLSVEKILADTDAEFLELFCFVDEAVRQERFRIRAASGGRHPAHLDTVALPVPEQYAPFDLGDRIDVDTAQPLGPQYDRVVSEIKKKLAAG